jgi:multiple sugar transport system ATP-binding protein
MDEPLSNLDAKLRVQMRREIIRLQRKLKTTTIYVTHDQVEAMTMGDRIMVLKFGKIQQIGAPEILYNSPANMFVAQFIGSPAMNTFSGQMESDSDGITVVTDLGRFSLPAERAALLKDDLKAGSGAKKIMCGIRPEDVSLVHNGEPDRARGRVDLVEALGADAHVSLVFDDFMMLARTPADDRPREDDMVSLDFNMNKFHMFDAETEVNLIETPA